MFQENEPAWMKQLKNKQVGLPTESRNEVPAWKSELRGRKESNDTKASNQEIPLWKKEMQDRKMRTSSCESTNSDQEVPSWKKEMNSLKGNRTGGLKPKPSINDKSLNSEQKVPSWKNELNTLKRDGTGPGSKPQILKSKPSISNKPVFSEQEVPSWKKELSSLKANESGQGFTQPPALKPKSPVNNQSAIVEEEIPSWKKEIDSLKGNATGPGFKKPPVREPKLSLVDEAKTHIWKQNSNVMDTKPNIHRKPESLPNRKPSTNNVSVISEQEIPTWKKELNSLKGISPGLKQPPVLKPTPSVNDESKASTWKQQNRKPEPLPHKPKPLQAPITSKQSLFACMMSLTI